MIGAGASFLLTCVSLGLFAIAMSRHQRHVLGRVLTARMVLILRIGATALLVVAPLPWMVERGATMSLVTWIFCGTPLAGLVVAAALTKKGRS